MDGKDEKTGRFLPGNRFWEARSSHGRKPIFRTAEELWGACEEYFEWNEANPLYADRIVTYQGQVQHVPEPKMRAMTIGGLCLFLDITHQTWLDWKEQRSDFLDVITQAEQIIRKQKFDGAAAEMLNANIIARDLGLAEKSDVNLKDGIDIAALRAEVKQLAAEIGITLPAHITGEADEPKDGG